MKTILENNRKKVDVRVLENGTFEVYFISIIRYEEIGRVQEDCDDVRYYKSEKALMKRAIKYMNN